MTHLPKKLSFESALEKLQLSVKSLESVDLSLEESLKQFEEGVQLTRICQDYLAVAEQKVEILIKAHQINGSSQEETPQLQPFGTIRPELKGS